MSTVAKGSLPRMPVARPLPDTPPIRRQTASRAVAPPAIQTPVVQPALVEAKPDDAFRVDIRVDKNSLSAIIGAGVIVLAIILGLVINSASKSRGRGFPPDTVEYDAAEMHAPMGMPGPPSPPEIFMGEPGQ